MIYLNSFSKSYGGKDLFSDLSLSINRGEKVGLVGPNGAGKTTLFLMILGEIEPSSGNVRINKNIRIGYLPQEVSFNSNLSVLAEVIEGDEAIKKLVKEKKTLEASGQAASARYGAVLHSLEFLGYFELEHKTKKILMGLGFKESDFQRSIKQMSGGWQMRILLAKLLICRYDILLLDEPTNYLDLTAALWFKDYLANFKESFIMISHDKDFLNQVTNYTLVLENGRAAKVKGNYDKYRKLIDQRRVFLLKQFSEQDKKRQQLQKFIHRFHGQPNKASQVRAKKRMIEKMQEVIVPENRRESIRKFHFPQTRRSGHLVISLDKISKAYGDLGVYKDFDFEVIKGERAVLAGENGAGKSTLLKILAGVIDIDEGQRTLGHNIDIGYFSQTRMDVLDPQKTVFEEAYSASGSKLLPENIRTILGAFLFSGDDVEKRVKVLSGGEKSRLILAKLLINPPNFLLLDEPTTHLDVDAVDALVKALTEYEGTLVFISHDIHFVRSVANTVFEVKNQIVRKFPGNFDYYWQKVKDDDSLAANRERVVANPAKKSNPEMSSREAYQAAKAEKNKRRGLNVKVSKEIKSLRKEKEKLEIDRNVKARILSNPRSYHNKEMIIEYGQYLKQIELRLLEIDREIKELKVSFFE